VVEFVFLGVLVLVPLIYLVLTLARIQSATYSVTSAAREAGRAFTTARSEQEALPRARAAAALSFEDFGFADTGARAMSCAESPCLRADAKVQATATIQVPLPFVPGFLAGAVPSSVTVSSTHVASVDRFAGR
jgi:hypothetical protein